ncbi:hypothetical protein TWF696_004990 [Orbilia brochopaga]|uniref:Uncharacterized protein n=1 Tax=Orbilia brochopaga TaxID=3140254 RepID=A0AAV9UZE0_9PEZI
MSLRTSQRLHARYLKINTGNILSLSTRPFGFGLRVLACSPHAVAKQTRAFGSDTWATSEPVHPPLSVAQTFVREFQNAKIAFTPQGIPELERCCAPFSYAQIFPDRASDADIYELLQSFLEVPEYDPTEDEEYLLRNSMWAKFRSPRSPWRSEYAWHRYQRYKVWLIWEALYYRSPKFKKLMEQEEIGSQSAYRGDRLATGVLWQLLELFYRDGLVNRGDVDRLPDPIVYTLGEGSSVESPLEA